MNKKKDYFSDETELDKYRQKRSRKRKGKKAGKTFLLIIALIIIALAAFLTTIKVIEPNYDFSALVPDRAAEFVDKNILGKITITQEASETTSKQTTTQQTLTYLDFEEFDFKTSVQGNYIGNILNSGKVGTDFTYIYHIVDGKGIYRFNPSTESYTVCYKTTDKLSSLNLRGDYFYYVNESNNNLYKLQKGSSKPKKVAENVRLAYVYDSIVYFVTNDNKLCAMDVKELVPVTAYFSADYRLDFIGISLDRIFFSLTDEYNNIVEYRTVDAFGHENAVKFREDEALGSIMYPVMENGFLYYYEKQSNGSYNLCRQKFGSEKPITLAEDVQANDYPTVDSNRLYYSEYSNGKYKMLELNMNSGKKKTLISAKADEAVYQHGGEYDFIIGDDVYSASCVYTSSTNIMKFKNGKWKY